MKTQESPNWLKLPVEVRRQKVLDEIVINRGLNEGYVDLNNFYCLFFPSDHDSISNQRKFIIDHAGGVNKPINKGNILSDTDYSAVFLSQTPQEYFEVLDRTVKEQHVDIDQIRALLSEYFSLARKDVFQPEDMQKLQREIDIINRVHELLLPVYIELRIQGYNDADLGVS